jgi:ubiquitin carboxyl-terminal hydrolase 8
MQEEEYEYEPDMLIHKGKTGLANLGNTCYINAASQCLSHTVGLRHFFLSKEYEKYQNNSHKSSVLVDQWYDMLTRLWSTHKGIKPEGYVGNVKRISANTDDMMFVGYGQNDSQEYLSFFMNQMHEVLKREVIINVNGEPNNLKDELLLKSYNNWKLYYEKDYSEFVNLFHGQMINIVDCPETEEKRFNFEPFSTLQLSVPKTNRKINIYECIDAYTSYSILDGENAWYSEKANEKKRAYRYNKFWKMPKYMFILLKRFTNQGDKINTQIEYPDTLDLEEYCLLNTENTKYRLYGIINHFGGVMGGHYTAHCKNGEQWREFDDLSVDDITPDKALDNQVSAYVLFYEQV